MEKTPKVQKRSSLSLGNRINRKRHSASPQNQNTNFLGLSALNIESTPTHKKSLDLDDVDFSPKTSPICMLSQTVITDSPEVDWRWSKRTAEMVNRTTDNGVKRADFTIEANNKKESWLLSKNQQRRVQEQELRRTEKTRANEKLKERCSKLQKQLTENIDCAVEMEKKVENNRDAIQKSNKCPKLETAKPIKETSPIAHTKLKSNDALSDFLNDSDSDCFLLAATQQLESHIIQNTKELPIATTSTIVNENGMAPAATTPTTSKKEKRMSYYMQFLEDETPDDWFLSLDDAVLQETQAKKSRVSLQRYKSMPTPTTSGGTSTITSKPVNSTERNSRISPQQQKSTVTGSSSSSSANSSSRIKRHASINVLSPVSAHSHVKRRK